MFFFLVLFLNELVEACTASSSELVPACQARETEALRSGGTRRVRRVRSAALAQRECALGGGETLVDDVDECDGVRRLVEREREKERRGDRLGTGKGEKERKEKGELFRFLTTSERRRLSVRPTP